jgi:predicted nucleic acid-binding protein
LMTAGQAAWCDVVRLELWAGARGPHEKKALAHLGSTIQNLKIDDLVWQAAIKLAEKARDAGLNVPACDLIIVSCARRHGVPIEHCDKHIAHLQSLLT